MRRIYPLLGLISLLLFAALLSRPEERLTIRQSSPAAVAQAVEPSPQEPQLTEEKDAAATPARAPISVRETGTSAIVGPKKPVESESTPISASPPPEPPFDEAALNAAARRALVNIFCTTDGGIAHPVSGSGVIIDPRGVILTNAHVAQFVLLSTQPEVNLSCVVRTGSPARVIGTAQLLYMPASWVATHAGDIRSTHPLGTGEEDYALLLIDGVEEKNVSAFPFLPVETRNTGIPGDPVLLAAYPAEFSGSGAMMGALDASSAIGSVKQLMTFKENTVDVLSLGGIALAQSGSSGGAVVDAHGRLIGILSTTSSGETTADRDLHAITLSYVNRALIAEADMSLRELLASDPVAGSAAFMRDQAPALADQIIEYLR